jgi:hypothetical protein
MNAASEKLAASTVAVESLVSLEYPNGRTHHATILGEAVLQPGQEFDLHGRRWRAVELGRTRRSSGEPARIRCKQVERQVDPADAFS